MASAVASTSAGSRRARSAAHRRSNVPVGDARPVRRRRVLPRTRAPRRDLPDLGRGSAHPGATTSAAIRLVDTVPAGHRAMVLRTYDLPDDTVTAE